MFMIEIKYIFILFLFYNNFANCIISSQIDFKINNSTVEQSVYLLDLNLDNIVDVSLNSSEFYLKKDTNLVFLVYVKNEIIKCIQNHQLDLFITKEYSTNKIELNVTISFSDGCFIHNKLNIEYIYKISNESEYGLIKDDMNTNGIIAIVRLDNNLTEIKNELVFKSIKHTNTNLNGNYFSIKKFLSNFYMICLTENTRHLFQQLQDKKVIIQVNLLSFDSKNTLATNQLEFKLINVKNLEVEFLNKNSHLELTEQHGFECNSEKRGFFLYNTDIQIDGSLFENKNDNLHYIKQNIRFSVTSSKSVIDIDSVNGNLYLLPGTCLDREVLSSPINVNIMAYDLKKLFKTSYFNLSIIVKDVNDNAPTFKQNEYYLRLNNNNITTSNQFIIFDEEAIDFDLGLFYF